MRDLNTVGDPATSPRRLRACLLVNPSSGADAFDNTERISRIWSRLHSAGIWAEVVETRPHESPEEVARRAAGEGFSMVIACGGDGTVSAAARGLVDTDCSLGVIPMGTYNNFARSLGIPADLRRACKIIARGRTRRIDVGVANDEHFFFEAAGVGIDAQLFPLGEEIKSGRWSRLWEAARLAYQAQPSRIHFELNLPLAEAYRDAEAPEGAARPYASGPARALDFSAFLLIVAIGPYYGSGFTVAPEAVLDDGLFNVEIFRNFSKHELLRHFWSISRGRYCYSPKIDTFAVSELTITAQADLPFHVDGIVAGKLPLRLRVKRRALKVLA